MSSSILDTLAATLAAAHNYSPFSTHPAYVLPDAHALDETLRHHHFGEPQTSYVKAALAWAEAHLAALYGDVPPPPAPAPWLDAALGLDEPFAYPQAQSAPPAEPAPEPAPAPEPKKRSRKKAPPEPVAEAPRDQTNEVWDLAAKLAKTKRELQETQAEQDRLIEDRAAMERRHAAGLAAVQADRDAAREQRDKAVAERDAAWLELDSARLQAESFLARPFRKATHDEEDELRRERDEARAERDELRRKLDAARVEVADLGVELEKANARRFAEIFWQAHRTNADGVELVRVHVRREETLLASVCPAEGGGWWWATADGDEGKAKSEERARSLAAFAVGEEVDDE